MSNEDSPPSSRLNPHSLQKKEWIVIYNRFLTVSGLIACLFATASCEFNKESAGTLLGGGAGALAGSAFGKGSGRLAMVAAGTLLGAFVGNRVGSSLDKADQMYAEKTSQRAFETLPSNQQMAWQNPDSGHSGTITPIRTIQDPTTGRYCREFQQTITVGGKTEKAYGRACRQPDGNWEIVQ